MSNARRKKKPRKLEAIDVEELSLVDKPACQAATFAIIKAAAADPEAEQIAAALKTFLGGETFAAPTMADFKQAIVMLDQNLDRIPEDVLSDVRFLGFIAAEALAEGLIKLKEAEAGDEADAIDEGANGKGKAGLKKSAGDFPSLGRESFLQNFCFGSRIEKWKADEAIEKAAAAADSDPEGELEPEIPVRKPTRKSLTLAGDEDDEDETEARPRSFSIPIAGFGPCSISFGQPKAKIKKSLAERDAEDPATTLWPSLG
jgi:hypothetical protein